MMTNPSAVAARRAFFARSGAFSAFGVAAAAAALMSAAPAASAAPKTINFNNYQNGRHVNDEYSSLGVSISADNYRSGGPDIAILFDSDLNTTPDDDLEFGSGWSAGNIRSERLDKFLIIAENVTDTSPNDGFVDNPDDEAAGGTIKMRFNTPQTSLGFDLIDVELTPELDRVEFRRLGVPLMSISFDQFREPGPFFEPGVVYADRSANRISPMSIADLGIVPFDEVYWYMPECAAIDNIVFDSAPVVPEPATAALVLGAVVPALAMRRRRR